MHLPTIQRSVSYWMVPLSCRSIFKTLGNSSVNSGAYCRTGVPYSDCTICLFTVGDHHHGQQPALAESLRGSALKPNHSASALAR